MNIRRRKNKNDLSTRRLSFSNSISDTPNTTRSKKSPLAKPKNINVPRRSSRNSITTPQRKEPNASQINHEPEFGIKDLLGKRWTVYRVSPLYNFNPEKLKIYGRKLSEELCSISNRFNENAACALKASFAVSNDLNPSHDGFQSIQVKVTTDKNRNNYTGYFVSWKEERKSGNFRFFPLLLVQGNKQTQNVVHQALCKFFDCDIGRVNFSLKVLAILFTKYLEKFKEDASDLSVLSLQYRIPNYPTKDSITVTLSLADMVAVLLILLHHADEDIDPTVFCMQLYDKVLCEIFNVYRINLTPAKLFKVVFPDSVITADGEVKWSSKEIAMIGLSLIEELISLDETLNIHK